MKVGDTLICKKSDFGIIKGDEYSVEAIIESVDFDYTYYCLSDIKFNVNDTFIENHFYTKEEIRQLKLESL